MHSFQRCTGPPKGGRQFQTGKTQRVQKDSWTTNIPESSQQLHATMALDLNIPPTADEEDDPFGGWSRTTHHLLEHNPWEMEMEQLLLTSTWLCMTQVSEFVGPQHTALMLLNTWFALVLGFTSDFIWASKHLDKLWLWVLLQTFLTLLCRWSGWLQCPCSTSNLGFKHGFRARGGRYSTCKVKSSRQLIDAFHFIVLPFFLLPPCRWGRRCVCGRFSCQLRRRRAPMVHWTWQSRYFQLLKFFTSINFTI